MKRATIALTVTGLVLAAGAVYSGATTAVGLANYHAVTTSQTLAVPGTGTLTVRVDGPISVSPAAPTAQGVEFTAHAGGSGDMPQLVTTATGDGASISLECPNQVVVMGANFCKGSLDLAVPAGMTLTLESSSGAITVQGEFASLTAHSGQGDITVEGASLGAKLSTGSGHITASGIAGDLSAHSGQGDLHIDNVAGDVSASTSSGMITASAVTGALVAKSGQGDISADRVTGKVDARSESGKVTVEGDPQDAPTGAVTASSGQGDIRVMGIDADVRATSSSGQVAVRASRNVVATSGQGDVTVTAWDNTAAVNLDISTGQGKSTVQAPTDPASAIAVTIHSASGNVTYAAAP